VPDRENPYGLVRFIDFVNDAIDVRFCSVEQRPYWK
jgi:hypothetical protein